MKVLAIETSCDETGIALLEGEKVGEGFVFTTLKNALLSQAALHAPYGGVYPALAKREHEKNLPILFQKFQQGDTLRNLDAIAVTHGPGLEPALWQGITFAQKLSAENNIPLFGVNHMEAHLISSLALPSLGEGGASTFELKNIKLPVLALLISGGHTEFVLMKEWFKYEIIGETLDDAVGECFDKVARMLDLPYPGGPEISKLAANNRTSDVRLFKLPRPMLNSGTCDVSFSGLKTAALYALRGRNLTQDEKVAFAAEFEDAVADVFVAKTRLALSEVEGKTFVIGGGVAANRYLRERLQQLILDDFPDVEFRLPEPSITGDNAVMIAQCALAHLLSGDWNTSRFNLDIKAVGNLSLQGDTFQS